MLDSQRLQRLSTLFRVSALVGGLTLGSPLGADCLKNIPSSPTFDFARVILAEAGVDGLGKAENLRNACAELNLTSNFTLAEARRRARRSDQEFRQIDYWLQTKNHFDSVQADLGNNATEKKYLEEIARIQRVTDPMMRLRLGFQLARARQGRYMDPETRNKDNLWVSPRATLARVRATGEGGICRDFASLLAFTLDKVARGPDKIPAFSAEFLGARNHAMVKVRMAPAPQDRFGIGQQFALDSTNFDQFNPIPVPDFDSPDSVFAENRERCERIVSCVSDENREKYGPSVNRPSPYTSVSQNVAR